jgi:2-keto-4-pentenoate hydratase
MSLLHFHCRMMGGTRRSANGEYGAKHEWMSFETSVTRLTVRLSSTRQSAHRCRLLSERLRGRFAIASRRGTSEAVSLDAAYELGRDLESERISAGWRPVGWKLGFTNQALWSRLGLDRPIRARIYEQTLCVGELDSSDLVQARIEPEIVFGFGADLVVSSRATREARLRTAVMASTVAAARVAARPRLSYSIQSHHLPDGT